MAANSREVVAQPAPEWSAIGVPPAQLGMWIFMATVSMLFAALLSAYLVRSVSADWVPVRLPSVLWWNTGFLLASSAALEIGRRRPHMARPWLLVTLVLGTSFLIGQVVAWRQLVDAGVYIPTTPHSSFLYIFTGLHGLHLLGGLLFLAYVSVRLGRRAPGPGGGLLVPCATYWHFLGVLWFALFVILYVA